VRGDEVVYIRNLSIKIPHGFAYAIQAKLRSLYREVNSEHILHTGKDQPWKILEMSRTDANAPEEGTRDNNPGGPTSSESPGGSAEEVALANQAAPEPTHAEADSFSAATTITTKVNHVMPGTLPLEALPRRRRQLQDTRLRIIHAQAIGLPNPMDSSFKISFAKFKEKGMYGNGNHVQYLFQQIRSLQVPLEQSQGLKDIALYLFGPTPKEIEDFKGLINQLRHPTDKTIVGILRQWTSRGALSDELPACNAAYTASTSKGRAAEDQGKVTTSQVRKGRREWNTKVVKEARR
jgi:hypothetical protein